MQSSIQALLQQEEEEVAWELDYQQACPLHALKTPADY